MRLPFVAADSLAFDFRRADVIIRNFMARDLNLARQRLIYRRWWQARPRPNVFMLLALSGPGRYPEDCPPRRRVQGFDCFAGQGDLTCAYPS